MNPIARTFLRGLLAFLPVFLTVYSMIYFVGWLNRACNHAIAWVWPAAPDLPGLGIMLALAAIFILGALVSARVTRRLFALLETPLRKTPVVKELYTALKQLTTLFAADDPGAAGKVVSVSLPDVEGSMVGLLMRSDVETLDDTIAAGEMVAVYLPMSYQIGGFTVFVPAAWVQEVDMSVEAAMRNALTGWAEDKPEISAN